MRYLKLYLYFLKFSISRNLEFRLDFFFRIIMDLIYYGVSIGLFAVLYLHTDELGGWNRDQAMVFVSGFLVVDAIIMTFVANNFWILPDYINRGELDYHLTRPVSPLFILSLRDFAVNSLINLMAALGLLVYTVMQLPGTFNVLNFLFYVVLLFIGAILYYSLRLLTILPVFWTFSGRGFDTLFWSTVKFMERPDRIFHGVMRTILLTALPFGVMASLPARLFLDGFDLMLLLHMLAITLLFFLIALYIWKRGLASYTSASS